MTKNTKSARHHWWPECVSERWADPEGCVHWLSPAGSVKRIRTKNLGVIGNGHMIKLGAPDAPDSLWDENFEPQFDGADGAFPGIISWLESLTALSYVEGIPLPQRFLPQTVDHDRLAQLSECVVSLAVRSPKNRAAAVSLAEHLRGPLPPRERNALIGLNMRNTHREASAAIGDRAKFVAVFSPDRELIFGDGFFHNVRSPMNGMFLPQIFAPLTPRLAVLIVRTTSYRVEPRLTTLTIGADETEAFNEAVQVYAKDAIFYRSDPPKVIEAFRAGEHLVYSGTNVMEKLIHSVPGIPPRDPSLDALRAAFEHRRSR
jgi:hypothetical protein